MSLPVLTPAEVAAAGRDLPDAFACRLTLGDPEDPAGSAGDGGVAVVCRQVLRLLPGRRLVARVELADGPAVLKLFLGGDAGRYWRRESAGCAILARAGVTTPAPRGTVYDPAGPARGLLFEYLPDARPLRSDEAASTPTALVAAVRLLARLHRSGAVHRDLHLENFLLTPAGEVALVDGDGVRSRSRGPLGRRRSLADLATLCAELSPMAPLPWRELAAAYAAERGWPQAAGGAERLAAATRRARRARLRRYFAKAGRDCSEFRVARTFRRTVLSVRALPEHVVARFAANPEAAFADARVLKAGNSATVVRSELGGRPCVIKRYNRKSLWQVLRRALRPVPRYRRAWRNGQALHLLGIPTARPLVLVERRVGPWRGVAYLVMEDLGDADLASELAGTGAADQRLEAAVALLRALAVAGLVHGDTKASNFLVHGERVAVVDLDAMRLGGRGQRRDLVRFLANFDGRPALRARCATLLGAVGLAPDREVGFAPPRRPL